MLGCGALCRCRPLHRGRPVDVEALNRHAPPRDAHARWPFLIVPGYTPRFGWSEGLHPKAIARLEHALADLEAGLAPAVIVSGGAVHSPDNEAVLMRAWLIDRGVDERRILVEPCARHSTTNLRNAGRMLLQLGVNEALVVTSDWRLPSAKRGPREDSSRRDPQGYYLGFPWLSSFHARCLVELGFTVGELGWLEPGHVRFRPSRAVFRGSWKETRAGDP